MENSRQYYLIGSSEECIKCCLESQGGKGLRAGSQRSIRGFYPRHFCFSNRIPLTGWPKQQTVFAYISGGWEV